MLSFWAVSILLLSAYQAMLRALSRCRNHSDYGRLLDEPVNISLLDGRLKRAN